MPKSRSNGMPAYQKIQATIMKRIDSGQLKPGDAVDSERELAKIHQSQPDDGPACLNRSRTGRYGAAQAWRGHLCSAASKVHFNKLMSYTEQMSGTESGGFLEIAFSRPDRYGAGNCSTP